MMVKWEFFHSHFYFSFSFSKKLLTFLHFSAIILQYD